MASIFLAPHKQGLKNELRERQNGPLAQLVCGTYERPGRFVKSYPDIRDLLNGYQGLSV